MRAGRASVAIDQYAAAVLALRPPLAAAGAGSGSVIKLLSLDVKAALKSSSGNSLVVHS